MSHFNLAFLTLTLMTPGIVVDTDGTTGQEGKLLLQSIYFQRLGHSLLPPPPLCPRTPTTVPSLGMAVRMAVILALPVTRSRAGPA